MKPFPKSLSLLVLAFSLVVLFVPGLGVQMQDMGPGINTYSELLEGTVTQVEPGLEQEVLTLKVEKGRQKGDLVEVPYAAGDFISGVDYKKGDALVIMYSFPPGMEPSYAVVDYVRHPIILKLFLLFLGLSLLVTRWQGVTAFTGMAFSFAVLAKGILPLILNGFSPVWVTLLGMLLIVPVSFGLSHGWSKKTAVAMAGTLLTLIITGLLAAFFSKWAHLTGFASEEASYLRQAMGEQIQFLGLVLAGMIISILGVLDDVTISQAAVVSELHHVDQKLPPWRLYAHAMRVGHDHIASIINTLVLIYVGSALPLVLLFMQGEQSFVSVLNYENVAQELIQMLVGSIGLILAVPLTTLVAVFILPGSTSEEASSSHHRAHK